MLRIASLVLAAFAGATAAAAQGFESRPAPPAGPGSPAECGARAALYAAGKVQVWVLRTGTMPEVDPLRPLSPKTLLVFQVVVNGRSATAFGPSHDAMRQGGAPARLEETSGSAIAWESGKESLPRSFRVVSEDGQVLLGPLAFQSCGEAPAIAAEKPARGSRPQSRPRGEGRGSEEGRGSRRLPQGAIPSGGGGGLSLPQP